ncbi:MAG: sigma-70 family RNA polymerase sigma factor [Acidobacteriota bacterium]
MPSTSDLRPSRAPFAPGPEAGSFDTAAAPPAAGDVSRLLVDWRRGSEDALEQLTPLVYGELRRLAQHYMNSERDRHMLQATALVHEAFLRLVDLEMEWRDRQHFFAMAGRLMRRVLVEFARKRDAEKRGGGERPVTLVGLELSIAGPIDMIGLDDALQALEKLDARKTRVVELRCFAGLTIRESAEVLGVSEATVERDFKMAKAWLVHELRLA